MHTAKQAQRGFTLIEVTLAVVIGVIVIGGAITLYRQTIVSAGNSRAQTKVAALATVVEEMGTRMGTYPTHDQLRSVWAQRRPDYMLSPWGGDVGSNGLGPAMGLAMSGEPFSTPWEPDRYRNIEYRGVIAYMVDATGGSTKTVTDANTGKTRTFRSYVVAIWNQEGRDPCFPMGQVFGSQ